MKRCNIFFSICFWCLISCKQEDQVNSIVQVKSPYNKLYLKIENLKQLHGGDSYEAWVVLDGVPHSSGKFNLDSVGNVFVNQKPVGFLTNVRFTYKMDILKSSAFFITIEAPDDQDTIPSSVVLIYGNMQDSIGNGSYKDSKAFNLNFSNSAVQGNYVLGVQTAIPQNESVYGVWFANRDSTEFTLSPGLTLPSLQNNPNWTYQAWVRFNTIPVDIYYSVGRFLSGIGPDSSIVPAAAQNQVPQEFPGEDFIYEKVLPLNDGNYSLLITLEPRQDFHSGPFWIKLLESDIPKLDSAKALRSTQQLNSYDDSFFPTASARISQ